MVFFKVLDALCLDDVVSGTIMCWEVFSVTI